MQISSGRAGLDSEKYAGTKAKKDQGKSSRVLGSMVHAVIKQPANLFMLQSVAWIMASVGSAFMHVSKT